jgi:dTDP-4-dehydrorhamnose reductase
MKILGTGLSGLVGSRVVELLSPAFVFENYSLDTGVDITNQADITARISSENEAQWVVHMAAYTDVQGAERDRLLGKESAAWKVNVDATQYIAQACKVSGKRLLYVDTDYAFDGNKKEYSEDDVPNPLGWYAITKYEGAKRVLALGEYGLVIRISNPYRAHPVGKKDFAHRILERLQSGQHVTTPTDQIFTPTFVDDIAQAIHVLIEARSSGIYHVVGSTGISPFDAANIIASIYGCDKTLVKPTTFAEYFTGKAPSPQYTYLTNAKITKLGVHMHGFADGVDAMHRQETKTN